jgi:glycosidase
MSAIKSFKPENPQNKAPLTALQSDDCGKVYADVPLSFFSSIEDLKNYVLELKKLGVNVLLILPHFLPALSPYVVKSYEQPCDLFATWENFAQFMQFVADLGMDRMIDIPFNHADWEAHNLKREWFIEHENNGVEAGADDVDADNNRIRVNWGAYILDNANEELQNYWLEKVIFPHVEKYNVNSIRIDAAWGLDLSGLKRIIGETNKKR